MAQEPTVRVRLTVPNLKVLRGMEVDNGCMPIRQRQDGQIEMEAIVPERSVAKLKRLKTKNVSFEILEAPAALQEAAPEYFSRTNRYADGSLPQGLGIRRA